MAEVKSADGDRQGVGDVGRLGGFAQVQLQLDGHLHLVFRCVAVAGHDFLDFCGFDALDR